MIREGNALRASIAKAAEGRRLATTARLIGAAILACDGSVRARVSSGPNEAPSRNPVRPAS